MTIKKIFRSNIFLNILEFFQIVGSILKTTKHCRSDHYANMFRKTHYEYDAILFVVTKYLVRCEISQHPLFERMVYRIIVVLLQRCALNVI